MLREVLPSVELPIFLFISVWSPIDLFYIIIKTDIFELFLRKVHSLILRQFWNMQKFIDFINLIKQHNKMIIVYIEK
jgi:hypothetical protein